MAADDDAVGLSATLVVSPKEKAVAEVDEGFWAKENPPDTGVSFAGALDDSEVAELFGKTETGSLFPNPVKGGAKVGLLASVLFPSVAAVVAFGVGNKVDLELSVLASGLLKNDNTSFAGAAAGVMVAGEAPKKFEGTSTCALGFDNAADLAKKLGTVDEPLPVRVASSCSVACCLGAVANTDELPGLGGISAICGTVLMIEVRGAAAAVAVAGGEE